MNQLSQMIPFLRKRPKMYVPTGSYDEIVSFLTGWDLAMSFINKPEEQFFSGFQEFLDAKFGKSSLAFWERVKRLTPTWVKKNEEDQKYTDILFDLLEEYLNEQQ